MNKKNNDRQMTNSHSGYCVNYKMNACMLKAHSHSYSMSGGSI